MSIYLEMPELNPDLGFQFLKNKGDILTTPHWHREYEVILLTKGQMNLGINDKQFQLKEGGIAFFKSGDIHYIVATPDSNRYVYQFNMSLFNEKIAKKIHLMKRLNELSQISSFWPKTVNDEMRRILLDIAFEENNWQIDSDFVIESLMHQLITVMIRKLPKVSEVEPQKINVKSKEILETLNKVFIFIEKNYQNKVTLDDAAKEAGFSSYYFTRFFKKNVGQTFVEFLNNYRIDKAKWKIINSDDPISNIWNQSGFSNNKTFYRVFKQQVGMSPKQYRKKYNLNSN